MKTILTLSATIALVLAQIYWGINGLTLLSIPTTLFLGIHVAEKLTETEEQTDSETTK